MNKHTQEYDKYMKSEKWKNKRKERLAMDGYRCVMCQRPQERVRNGLQIHHINYANLGNENVETDLVSLCGTCHRMIHRYYKRNKTKVIAQAYI